MAVTARLVSLETGQTRWTRSTAATWAEQMLSSPRSRTRKRRRASESCLQILLCLWRRKDARIVLSCLFGWLTNVCCSVADAIGGPGKVSGATKTGRVDKRFNAWGSDAPDITEELKEAGLVEYLVAIPHFLCRTTKII
jgi:hypothetical protein